MKASRTRILWTSNIVLPAIAEELGLPKTPFGGWLSLMTERLAQTRDYQIGVAMRAEGITFTRIEKDGIVYYALPSPRGDRFDVLQADVDQVLADFEPDVLHIEGAEMRHALRFLSTWHGHRLLSMQGILQGYAPYELGRMPVLRMLLPHRPQICATTIALLLNRQMRFLPRLAHEQASMARATHIMGRTLWDRAQAKAFAPQATYSACNRILRNIFYHTSWMGLECEPFSIFVGNGGAPRKGAHIAMAALALLKRDFPDVKLYIAGEDPRKSSARSLKRYVGYPVYLLHLIRKLGLEENVVFTGILSEEAMAERMARSHICLMSSIIENSPNTLGEAMLIGAPVVSAYCGGAPSMAKDEEEALFYRPDDPAMMAFQIRRIFEDPSLAERLSQRARSRAQVTHDPDKNLGDLARTYEAILAGGTT